MVQTESNLTEHYRSNDMISGKTSSMSMRDDLQNSTANIWVRQNCVGLFLSVTNSNFLSIRFLQQPDISAGTLLSKTHEELVLLLIQLRRQVDMKERGITRRTKDMQTIQVDTKA